MPIATLREMFDEYSVYPDGSRSADDRYIPAEYVVVALRRTGLNPTLSSVDETMALIDTDCSGRISFSELEEFAKTLDGTRTSRADLEAMFKKFDVDGNGRLDRDEFAALLKGDGEPLSDDEVQQALQMADKDGDGFIDLEEFVDMLLVDAGVEAPPCAKPVATQPDEPQREASACADSNVRSEDDNTATKDPQQRNEKESQKNQCCIVA
jgi:calmodulin